ncbi:hypothetical protein E2C01_088753 [Portunus trituberculatus]|uniref:Uncharacterized protein n=1 Tax=Portunus trituberculatus TaxID=210409 RepID=A0A5B7JKQ4_PORTR|nr:hypothetical protein [Portunus trituberculatus]
MRGQGAPNRPSLSVPTVISDFRVLNSTFYYVIKPKRLPVGRKEEKSEILRGGGRGGSPSVRLLIESAGQPSAW